MNDVKPILEARGLGGARLLLFQDSVRSERKGLRAWLFQGTTGNIDIQLSSIGDIKFRKVDFLYRYMRFSLFCKGESNEVSFHYRDKNMIRFRLKQQPDFEAIEAAIENRKDTGRSNKMNAQN